MVLNPKDLEKLNWWLNITPADANYWHAGFANYDASQFKTLIDQIMSPAPPTAAQLKTAIAALPAIEKNVYRQMIFLLHEIIPQLDEEIDRERIYYRGYDARLNAPLNVSKTAFGKAMDLVRHCRRYLNHVSLGSSTRKKDKVKKWFINRRQGNIVDKALSMYQKWFDADLDSTRLNTVKQIFQKLEDAIATKAFEIVCDADPTYKYGPCACKPDWWGAAVPDENLYRFYICELSYTNAPQAYDLDPNNTGVGCKNLMVNQQDNIVVTMIHELTHLPMIGSTDDVDEPNSYDVGHMLDWAANDAGKAIRNADTYAYFALEVKADL